MGAGVSKKVHEEVVFEKDTKIENLETDLNHTINDKKSIELKRHESERNVKTLRERLHRLEHVQGELQQTSSERDGLLAELQQERHASRCMQQGFDAIAKALDSLKPVHDGDGLVIPEMDLDADESLNVPSDVLRAMRSTQVLLSDLQLQVNGHRSKGAMLTAKVKELEEVILQQKKKILVVENRNEKLKSEDPVRRMETMKRKASTQALEAHTKR
eukprot:m.726245 g.726245  ORF g.726245 m.726245 type:complete len:216 (-) comp23028_c0_seq68:410-1057(-)